MNILFIPKGTILYYLSNHLLTDISNESLLFLNIHPSEWQCTKTQYISLIELQSDISLLFFIKCIRNLNLYSSLNKYIDTNCIHSINVNKIKLDRLIGDLKNQKIDGWVSSIQNRDTIEFTLFNNPNNLKFLECLPINIDWYNTTYNDNILIPKNWGTNYPISTLTKPITIIFNSSFKYQIDSYLEKSKEIDPDGSSFSIMLKNARIIYNDKEKC